MYVCLFPRISVSFPFIWLTFLVVLGAHRHGSYVKKISQFPGGGEMTKEPTCTFDEDGVTQNNWNS